MTDNEIIKALEWFVSYCDGDGNKHHITIKDILDLINRQKAEIERLINAFKQVSWERDALLKGSVPEIYPYCVIGVVGVNGAIFTKSPEEYDKLIANIKAEAIKEFAETVEKPLLSQLGISTLEKKEAFYFCLDILDKAKKEMVGDK